MREVVMIDWNGLHIEWLARVLLALILGALIGWERERHGKHAGIRTYGAICLGACVFGLISQSIPGADPARVAAQVVSGIGFLCAGVIFQSESSVEGLTTAASLFSIAAIGLAVSFAVYTVALLGAALLFALLFMPEMRWWGHISAKGKRRAQRSNKKKILTR